MTRPIANVAAVKLETQVYNLISPFCFVFVVFQFPRGGGAAGRGECSGPQTTTMQADAHKSLVNLRDLGPIHVTKPYKFKRFGDIEGPKPFAFIGF